MTALPAAVSASVTTAGLVPSRSLNVEPSHRPARLRILQFRAEPAEIEVNGIRAPWLLDTGANQSMITRAFATRLGVTPLPGAATVGSGLTGRQVSIQAAVLPTMHVGGAALTNVVLLVIEDEHLRIGSGPDSYQINAILGYPILKALGVVTFTRDAFLAGEAANPDGREGRMYMRGLTPAIEGDVEGRPLLFTLDTERRAPTCQCDTSSCSVRRLTLGRHRPAKARAWAARFNRTRTSSHAWS